MGVTPKYGLITTAPITVDREKKVSEYIELCNGENENSNIMKLDKIIGSISDDVKILKNRKSIIPIEAIKITDNYYEANSLEFQGYQNDMLMLLYLDETNVGRVTLNINKTTVVDVKKVDVNGELIDLKANDLIKRNAYIFTFKRGSFVFVGDCINSTIGQIQDNIVAIQNSVKSVNDEITDIKKVKQNKSDNNLTTSTKEIVSAINEVNANTKKIDEKTNELDANKQNKTDDTLLTTNKKVVGAINELSLYKQYKADNTLKTTDKTVVGAINEVSDKVDTTNSNLDTHTKDKSIHSSNINYNATASYINGIYDLALENPPTTLPTNYTVNFNAPTNVKKGDKVRVSDSVVNLYGKGFNSPASEFILNSAKLLGNSYVSVTERVDAEYGSARGLKAKGILKPNATYTLIVDVKEWNASKHITINLPTWVDAPYNEAISIPTKTLGITKIKVTTKSEITDAMYIMRVGMANNGNGKNVVLREMLIEGDWTNRDLPCEYWENTFGEYSILTYGEDSPQIEDNAFVQGQPITLNVGLTGAFFKSGGGGGGSLPSTWLEKSNGIAQESIKKDDAIIRMKYGNMDNAISLADVSGVDSSTTYGFCNHSRDGKWLRLNRYMYKIGLHNTYSKYESVSFVSNLPSDFAQDSNYFVCCNILNNGKGFSLCSYTDDKFTILANIDVFPYNSIRHLKISPDGMFVFVGGSDAPRFRIYKRNSNSSFILYGTFDWFGFDTLSMSRCGTYVFARYSTAEQKILKRIGDDYVNATIPSITPSNINVSAFHPTANYLFMGYSGSSEITWYKRNNNDTWIKLPQPTIIPPGTTQSLEVSPCGNYLVIGCGNYNTANLIIYKIVNDELIKMPNPNVLPHTVTSNGMSFTPDGSKLVVTHSKPSTVIMATDLFYQTQEATLIKKLGSLELANRLATNKLLELGIGKADTNAEVNQNCNVTLIKGINEHLGGIYA